MYELTTEQPSQCACYDRIFRTLLNYFVQFQILSPVAAEYYSASFAYAEFQARAADGRPEG